jgi:hypothetical protein
MTERSEGIDKHSTKVLCPAAAVAASPACGEAAFS